MKRILFVAANALPVNGPEAIVNAKLLKVLADHGYIIDLISKDGKNRYFSESMDCFFSEKLNSIHIINVDNQVNFKTILGHLKVLLKTGYVYKGAHWAYYAIKCAEKLIKQHKYDFILSRNPSSEIVGLYISQKYNISWIANWNDPYPEKRMPTPYGGGKDAKLTMFEQKLLDNVSEKVNLHTFSSSRQRDYMLQYMKGVDLKRTMVIPHICLEGISKIQKTANNNGILKIVYSGNVAAPRNPLPFLQGVRKFIDAGNEMAKVEISFIGKQTADFADQIRSLNLESWVKVILPMAYLDNLNFIATQDVALIIEAPSDNSVYLPTKVGDYMQCERDIWAVSPVVGTLNDMYRKKDIKYFSDCINSESIASELSVIYNCFIQNNYVYDSSSKIIHEYLPETIMTQYKTILQ